MEIIRAEEKELPLVVDMKMKMFRECVPEKRRKGYASKIMEAVLNWLEEKGVHNVKMKPSGAGRLMYENMGFHDSGEMEKWI